MAGAGPPSRPCKGGNDEVGSRGSKIGTHAALVPAFAKPARVGPATWDAGPYNPRYA